MTHHKIWAYFLVPRFIKNTVNSYSCIRHTPSFDVQFWGKKVHLIYSYETVRYSCRYFAVGNFGKIGTFLQRILKGQKTSDTFWAKGQLLRGADFTNAHSQCTGETRTLCSSSFQDISLCSWNPVHFKYTTSACTVDKLVLSC